MEALLLKTHRLDVARFFSCDDLPFFSFFKKEGSCFSPLNLIEEVLSHCRGGIKSPIGEGVFLKNQESIEIGRGCDIEPGVMICGPCRIGEGCTLRHGAYIRAGTIIGDGCTIGHATEIVRSIVLDEASLAHFNYVGDSIVGRRVNLGAGSRLANLRHDKEEISLFDGEAWIPTGRKKLGAIVGDGASIGCNAVLNPGTLVLPEGKIYPCTSVKGLVSC